MTETPYGATAPGTVVLEIGPVTGALVLRTPADLAGREIEISPDSGPARRRHACVRQRQQDGGTGYAAIYDRLAPGVYTIWRDRVTPAATITVTGGQVTTWDWPAATATRAAKHRKNEQSMRPALERPQLAGTRSSA